MWKLVRGWIADEDGQGLAEYAWILVLVAAACAGVVGVLGSTIAEVLYGPVTRMF
jgi:Flp pilus assembly pilin Flp